MPRQPSDSQLRRAAEQIHEEYRNLGLDSRKYENLLLGLLQDRNPNLGYV